MVIEITMACAFLLRPYGTYYGIIITVLENSYTQVEDNYPKTLTC